MASSRRTATSEGTDRARPMQRFRAWATCTQWAVMLALIALTAWLIASDGNDSPHASPASTVRASSLSEILSEPAGKLAGRDIAELNLLAATGLQGVEGPEVSVGMKMLDEWAGIVRRESQRRLKASASQSQPSEATGSRLAATVLAEALRDQVGLNLLGKGSRDVDFRLPANVFIYGCLNGKKASSLSGPVVYVAVGRRLGYPLELAMAGERVGKGSGTFPVHSVSPLAGLGGGGGAVFPPLPRRADMFRPGGRRWPGRAERGREPPRRGREPPGQEQVVMPDDLAGGGLKACKHHG